MKIPVLDHGYVEFIEAWGLGKDGQTAIGPTGPDYHDPSKFDYEVGIVEAARQSTQGSFRGWEPNPCSCSLSGWGAKQPEPMPRLEAHDIGCSYHPGDKNLLKHLYNNNHATPFEFSGMVIEVQAPILVFREWHRHRTQSYNEMSARYAQLPDLCYIPEMDRALMVNGAGRNKQAGGVTGEALTPELAEQGVVIIETHCADARRRYEQLLQWGWPKELARGVLPFFQYSKMRATCNLRNWLAFTTLRCDLNAQWEIRQFANAVADIITFTFPRTFQLWQAKLSA